MASKLYKGRYQDAQQDKTLIHPTLPQPGNEIINDVQQQENTPPTKSVRTPREDHSRVLMDSHTFVVTADSQLGMIDRNIPPNGDWKNLTELEYCRKAISKINSLRPKPLFCCMCGDLVDMTAKIHAGTHKIPYDKESPKWTEEECDEVQDIQNALFRETFAALDPDIALVCLCGNHDIGNAPTRASIEGFKAMYGDDYLAFWANGTYNIVLNSCLISRPFNAEDLYQEQLEWLEERLIYSQSQNARNIFVFLHHPLFLYDEDEDESKLTGMLEWAEKFWGPVPADWEGFPDSYFPIPRERRRVFLELFEKYKVSACFAGHFHQNVVNKTSFGMEMVLTGPLSVLLESSGAKAHGHAPTETQGIRLVRVQASSSGEQGAYSHHYIPI